MFLTLVWLTLFPVTELEGLVIWGRTSFGSNQPGIKLDHVPCINAKFREDGSKLMMILFEIPVSVYDH